MLGRPQYSQSEGAASHRAQAEDKAGPDLIELAETADDQPPETLQVVFFRAGGMLFAIPAESVEQVQRTGGMRSPSVRLVADMGGRARDQLILVVRAGASRVWLGVDEVLEIAALPLEAIYALPRLVADRQRGGYVMGLAIRGDELAVLLDANALPGSPGLRAQTPAAQPAEPEATRREEAAGITFGVR